MKRLFYFILIIFFVGCGSKSPTLPPPTGGGGGGGGVGKTYKSVTIQLFASKTTLPADGVSTSTITATITGDGKPIPDGENVSFSTTLGTFQESGDSTATITSSGGKATVTLVAPRTEGTATVTATFQGKSSSISITIQPIYGENPPATINVNIEPAEITVYGTATVTAKIYDSSGKPVKNGTEVDFSTNFPESKLDPKISTTFNGVATATFTAGSKYGTATIIVTSGDVGTMITITVLPSKVGSILFASAIPHHIGVKGSTLPEVSEVKFQVIDNLGNPVVDGIKVDFTVSGPNGGEYVDPVSAGTKDGYATTFLHAGKIASPVHVIASVQTDSGVINTSSQTIYIGSGKPSASHFSLASETSKANIMGLLYYGLRARVTAYLSDRFGNFIPANTPISFFSEAGAITPGSLTDNYGTASADIQTEKPYPLDVTYIGATYLDDYVVYNGKTHNQHDGVVTIIAVTEGEETFIDENGNGEYDAGEPFIDLGEPYIDANDNGQFDQGEFYIDYNQNGMYDPPNGVWDNDTLIWTSTRMLFTSGVFVGPKGSGAYSNPLDFSSPLTNITISNGGYQIFWLRLVDGNLNPLASGTRVSITVQSTGKGTPKYTPQEEKTLDGTTSGFYVTLADPDSNTQEANPVVFYVVVKLTYPTGYKVELPPIFGSYR